ncbi:hypothetical protein ES711_02260 [Gelidibacter salicanalis]|uniref:Cytochrome oxidase complex assembly protein 1 n=1 Tax=Gelidibacter salicanalis TaxID=291193 RepID=A0A5C7AYG9_9FLAO|nr:cytochrome c oxidase assembly factor Coa1 family protein [Gelidibacter salicanalis]TXE10752.1 hypothetical protein ES711_02260 [Gelidibacter salicanalis]
MNNDLITNKNWWQRHKRWFVPTLGIVCLVIGLLISSGLGAIGSDVTRAYTDPALYEDALTQVKLHPEVTKLLGTIAPIDKFAILEGQIQYTNDDQTVNSTVRINGSKGKAKLDISADRVQNEWNYKTIRVRIVSPTEHNQTIEVLQKK